MSTKEPKTYGGPAYGWRTLKEIAFIPAAPSYVQDLAQDFIAAQDRIKELEAYIVIGDERIEELEDRQAELVRRVSDVESTNAELERANAQYIQNAKAHGHWCAVPSSRFHTLAEELADQLAMNKQQDKLHRKCGALLEVAEARIVVLEQKLATAEAHIEGLSRNHTTVLRDAESTRAQLTSAEATITRVEESIVAVRQRAGDVAEEKADYHYAGGLDWAASKIEAALTQLTRPQTASTDSTDTSD